MAGVGWGDVLGGVVAGLIASVLAWAVGRVLRWRRNRFDFGGLAGAYRVNEKWSEKDDGTATVSGTGPLLKFTWTLADGSEVKGTLAMNEQSRVTGAGSYDHVRGNAYGWGHFTFQVAGRKQGGVRLLVDGRFTDQRARQEIAGAWLWEMDKATLRERRVWGLRLL
jgi:hypothetical protein